MRLIQMPGDLGQGDVRRFLNQSQDFLGMGFNPVRAIIPALPTGPNMARLSPLIDPLDSRSTRRPRTVPPQNDATSHIQLLISAVPANQSKEVSSCRLASFTSPLLESQSPTHGNPLRFNQVRKRSS